MRTTYQQAAKGTPFCIEWPEWHIECADPDCEERALISPTGMTNTRTEALSLLRKSETEEANDWTENGGLWYCPSHTPE